MGYIIFVGYETDAERKRIDYLLDKWSGKAVIKKPRGTVIYIETKNPTEFLEELFSKLEGNVDEKVEVYKAEPLREGVEARKKRLDYTLPEEKRIVERFVGYLLSKLNASLTSSDAVARIYNVYTRKGRATIKVIISGNGKSHVTFEIEGFGEAVDFLADRIDEELKIFAGD
ncbi:hypothetical protein A3L09_09555 [Thermococcus profundus]|uniref:Uncharacterized protein n=1 Tax=Thermococcus profundus TaxID=49899 RepID=A0A2Z2MNJ1_THEPR|nr:hypothetical protein [Thermococcus profundus]ASJ03488.1 hypothetical protein A3L09_09555 [Thermococcus profundus]